MTIFLKRLATFIFVFFVTITTILYVAGPKGDLKRKLYWLYVETSDILRFERKEYIETLDLENINLLLSKKDIKKLARPYQKHSYYFNDSKALYEFYNDYASNNKWSKAKMVYKNDTIPIKIKCHGKSPDNHKNGNQVSLSIKLRGNYTFKGVKRFSLLIYWRIRRMYDEVAEIPSIHNSISKDSERLLFKESQLFNVSINGGEKHLYYMEYRVNDEYMRLINKPEKIVLRGGGEHSFIYAQKTLEEWNDSVHNYIKNSSYTNKTKRLIEYYYDSINNDIFHHKFFSSEDFLDIDYMANFHAIRLIGGFDGHGMGPKNLSVVFDTSNFNFYPVFHRDCPPKFLSFNLNPETAVNYNTDRGLNIYFGHYYARNHNIRYLSYLKLNELLYSINIESINSRYKAIKSYHDKLYFSSLLKSFITYEKYNNTVIENIKVLKEYLKTIGCEVKRNGNNVNVNFQHSSYIKIDIPSKNWNKLIIKRISNNLSSYDTIENKEQLDDYLLFCDLDTTSRVMPVHYEIKLDSENIIIQLNNAVTNQMIYAE